MYLEIFNAQIALIERLREMRLKMEEMYMNIANLKTSKTKKRKKEKTVEKY